MRVTNLVIDFIVIGVIILLTAFLLCYLFDPCLAIKLISNDFTLSPQYIPLSMVLLYIIGVFFDQLADDTLSLIYPALLLKDISTGKDRLMEQHNHNYQYCLQYVVHFSQNAYNYLSYRRTVIRILRAILFSLLILFLGSIISAFSSTSYEITENVIIIIVIVILVLLVRRALMKLYLGYYEAISNFFKAISSLSESECIQ